MALQVETSSRAAGSAQVDRASPLTIVPWISANTGARQLAPALRARGAYCLSAQRGVRLRSSTCASSSPSSPGRGDVARMALGQRPVGFFVASLVERTIRSTASSGSSCSHTRTTVQPASLSRSSVAASRCRFDSILARHQSAFDFGQVPCSGQPCQKHPSINTAKREPLNTRSASLRIPGTNLLCSRNRRPRRWRADRILSSGPVSRRLCLSMRTRA